MTTPPQVQKLFDRVDSMSLRERAMVAATVLAVLWAGWDALLMRPLNALEVARKDQLSSLAAQVSDLNRSIQQAATGRSTDPDTAARQELAALRAEIADLDRRLENLTANLVDPSEMAGLLEALLVETGRLEFVGMTTLPAESVSAEGTDSGLYRHGLTLRVRGNYLDALRYLEALEELRWRFFWESVEVVVDRHPTSDIRITVFTLGDREGVLGV